MTKIIFIKQGKNHHMAVVVLNTKRSFLQEAMQRLFTIVQEVLGTVVDAVQVAVAAAGRGIAACA